MTIPARFTRPAAAATLAAAALAVAPAAASAMTDQQWCRAIYLRSADVAMNQGVYEGSLGNWAGYWRYFNIYADKMEHASRC